jgi:hypothetical protein
MTTTNQLNPNQGTKGLNSKMEQDFYVREYSWRKPALLSLLLILHGAIFIGMIKSNSLSSLFIIINSVMFLLPFIILFRWKPDAIKRTVRINDQSINIGDQRVLLDTIRSLRFLVTHDAQYLISFDARPWNKTEIYVATYLCVKEIARNISKPAVISATFQFGMGSVSISPVEVKIKDMFKVLSLHPRDMRNVFVETRRQGRHHAVFIALCCENRDVIQIPVGSRSAKENAAVLHERWMVDPNLPQTPEFRRAINQFSRTTENAQSLRDTLLEAARLAKEDPSGSGDGFCRENDASRALQLPG